MKEKMLGYRKRIIQILLAFFGIFPWITYLKVIEYNEAECQIFSSYDGMGADMFLYYKERMLIGVAVFLIFWFIGERLFPDKVDNQVPLLKGNNRILFLLMGIFAGMALISTFFSEHSKNALWGSPTEGEGLFSLLSYLILILAFYNYFANEYGIQMMKKGITVIGGLTIILSMIQYLYTGREPVSLSLYNPSYYGGFVCFLIPFILMFYLQAKKRAFRICYGSIILGLFFCTIASNSTTALYLAILEYGLVMIFYLIKAKEKGQAFKKIAGISGIALLAALFFTLWDGGSIFSILKNANSASNQVAEDRFEIEDIELQDHTIILRGKENDLQISYEEGQILLTDGKNRKLDAFYEEGMLVFEEVGFEHISVEVIVNAEDSTGILAKILVEAGYDDTIDFYILGDGTVSGVGQNNQIVKDIGGIGVSDTWKKYYGLFTGRGYAWLNSLPILKDTIIKGMGPGNFAFYFKQQDYTGMLQTHESTKYIIDKPHNAYIQYGVNVGILGMIAFFAIFLLAGVRTFRGYRCQKSDAEENLEFQVGGMVSLAGFLIYSMINDSIITVTPVVCMITGLIFAIDYIEMKKGRNV